MSFDYVNSFKQGHAFNCYIADILRHFGVPDVEVPEWSMHKNEAELQDKTKNEKDITVDDLVLEVKSSGYEFDDIDDFPFEKIIVDTVYGFDQKSVKPFAYIHASQKGNGIFVTPVATKPHWTIGTVFDKQRQIDIECYFVIKRYCRPFAELVEILLERASGRATEV